MKHASRSLNLETVDGASTKSKPSSGSKLGNGNLPKGLVQGSIKLLDMLLSLGISQEHVPCLTRQIDDLLKSDKDEKKKK